MPEKNTPSPVLTGEPVPRGPAEKPRSLRAARGELLARGLQTGASALGRWAEANHFDLEVVAQRRDADGPMVDRALELVRRFIIERGLVLFGGLAIDYALRLVGLSIYPDNERPDFDVLSPRSVHDAYDLADLLQRAGFEGVGAVRAIHVQTMKVRVSSVWVADIGYAPRDVFDRIPTLEYGGMRVVHPDFQRMDQLLAFCFPFNNPPLEDIFHRWRKDLKRFNLFETHYPIKAPELPERPPKIISASSATPLVGSGLDLKVALHGFAAYAVLRTSLDELSTAFGRPPSVGMPRLSLGFPSDSSLEIEAPAGEAVVVVSPDPDGVVFGLPGPRWYDPYMDLVPASVKAGQLTVLSTRSRLIGAALVDAAPYARYPSSGVQALVVTPQYLLLHFLVEAHLADRPETRTVYLNYYAHTMALLRAAEAIFADALGSAEGAAEHRRLMDLFAASPFAPTIRTLGTVNHNAAYQIKMATNAERLRDTPPPALGLDSNLAGLLAGLPQNYYPETGKQQPPPYEYAGSALFRRSGQRSAAPGPP